MANWNNPTVNSNYVAFVDEVKNRDVDSALMFDGVGTNLPNLTIRWNQSNNRFERLEGGTWAGRTIGLSGGGTGATTASGARSNLGLGSMAQQSSNNVSISGGSVTGVSFSGTGTLSGNATTASTWQTARTLTIGTTGKSVNGGNNVTWSVGEIVGFTPVQQGGGTGMGSNKIYLGWTGSILRAQVDNTPFNLLHEESPLNASNISSGTLDAARLPSVYVPTSRTINAGTGLTGGGNLTENRTINMDTTAGAIGTYGFFWDTGSVNRIEGTTVAGSTLRWAASARDLDLLAARDSTPSGTWRAMGTVGYTRYGNDWGSGHTGVRHSRCTVFMRIS